MNENESTTYRTLDLIKATSFGWDQHHKLTKPELTVLTFIALRGKQNEPRMGFTWFPSGGQEWWADIMALPHGTLRKTLHSLRNKDLIVNLNGSSVDNRFMMTRGYGIPEHVMASCKEWYEERQEMVYTRVPNTIEEIVDINEIDIKPPLTNDPVETPKMFYMEHECSTGEHGCSTGEHGCSIWNICNPVSREFTLHTHINTQIKTRDTTQLLTDDSRPPVAPLSFSGEDMNYEDEWSSSKEDMDRVRSKKEVDSFNVPREVREKQKPQQGPVNRLVGKFQKKWEVSREKRLNLSVPWSVRKITQANMKKLLETHSEDEVSEMIDVFFRMIDSGQIPLKAPELWKDFWYNRAKLFKLAKERMVAVEPVFDSQAELESFRRRLEQRTK